MKCGAFSRALFGSTNRQSFRVDIYISEFKVSSCAAHIAALFPSFKVNFYGKFLGGYTFKRVLMKKKDSMKLGVLIAQLKVSS